MKKFKSMDCPVCGQFHFSGPNKYLSPEEIEEELREAMKNYTEQDDSN